MTDEFHIVSDTDLVLGLASLVLLLYLMFIYVRLYLELRQKFTLAFILFTGLLLVNNLSGTGFLIRQVLLPQVRPRPPGPGPAEFGEPNALLFLRLVPSALEFIALVVLVWISRE
jgi:hypothetical protein